MLNSIEEVLLLFLEDQFRISQQEFVVKYAEYAKIFFEMVIFLVFVLFSNKCISSQYAINPSPC